MKRRFGPGSSPHPKSQMLSGSSQDSNYEGFRFLMPDSQEEMHFLSDGAESFTSASQQSFKDPSTVLRSALESFLDCYDPSTAAKLILEFDEVKNELFKLILSSAHDELKSSLKHSKLKTDYKDRNYLLQLTPRDICKEFQQNANSAFHLLVRGLLGLTNVEEIFESQVLQNRVCLVFSIVSQCVNRKAVAYALLLTSSLRDGGLREDSLKLLSCLVHPRTSQKYERSVLARDWDAPRKEALKLEKDHFLKIRQAEIDLTTSLHEAASDESIEVKRMDLKQLIKDTPPQLQLVWDNMNMVSKHRFERGGDVSSGFKLDWMGSLWIKDKISSNHMIHKEGEALMDIENLRKGFISTLIHYLAISIIQLRVGA